MYLNGAPAYEALSPSRAEAVYGRFQNELIRSAEAEFTECLLENIELRADSQQIRGPVFTPTESELALVRTVLQEDPRYRQLSRLWELRDSLVASFCAFLAHPQPSHCFSRSRCLDAVGHDGLLTKFMGFEPSSIPVVTLNVRGAPQHVAQFVTDVACLLKGDPYQSAVGLARIHCYSTSHGDTPQNFPIHVQLIDSSIREEDLDPASDPYPPILVAVADPHADASVVPMMVELEERRLKVDLRVGSVHGWLAARHAYATHGHALVYSTSPILLIAVQDGSTESELEQELEAEGREVAASVGALFVATPDDFC
ncbi:unnamed protein product, partial [Mesorhabditis spiculigera]